MEIEPSTCPVCTCKYGVANIPHVLLCGHTLCILCVQQLERKSCPVCRCNFQISNPNYALTELLHCANAAAEQHQSELRQLESQLAQLNMENSIVYNKILDRVAPVAPPGCACSKAKLAFLLLCERFNIRPSTGVLVALFALYVHFRLDNFQFVVLLGMLIAVRTVYKTVIH